MNWSKWSNHWIAYLPIPMLHNLVWLYDNLNWQPSPWPRLSGTFQEGPNITGSEVFTWQTTLTIMQWFSINQKSSFNFPFFYHRWLWIQLNRWVLIQHWWKYLPKYCSTNEGYQNDYHFTDIFTCIFLNTNFLFWFKFLLSLFLSVQLTNSHHCFK